MFANSGNDGLSDFGDREVEGTVSVKGKMEDQMQVGGKGTGRRKRHALMLQRQQVDFLRGFHTTKSIHSLVYDFTKTCVHYDCYGLNGAEQTLQKLATVPAKLPSNMKCSRQH